MRWSVKRRRGSSLSLSFRSGRPSMHPSSRSRHERGRRGRTGQHDRPALRAGRELRVGRGPPARVRGPSVGLRPDGGWLCLLNCTQLHSIALKHLSPRGRPIAPGTRRRLKAVPAAGGGERDSVAQSALPPRFRATRVTVAPFGRFLSRARTCSRARARGRPRADAARPARRRPLGRDRAHGLPGRPAAVGRRGAQVRAAQGAAREPASPRRAARRDAARRHRADRRPLRRDVGPAGDLLARDARRARRGAARAPRARV